MSERHFPRWREIKPLIGTSSKRPGRLQRALTVEDLRQLAMKRTPRAVFDYVEGAAEDELSITRARTAFESLTLHPRVLRDVSRIDTSATILGTVSRLPLILAPTGFTRMMRSAGEIVVAAAAAEAGIPYTLSTMGTTSIEQLAAAVPSVNRWFQLYIWKDHALSHDLLARARAHGYRTLVITVDVPVQGGRRRDTRNGLTIPPRLTLRTVAGMARFPRWWADLLTSDPVTFATMTDTSQELAKVIHSMFDPSVTWQDLDWVRQHWDGPIVIKGIQSVEDAVLARKAGVQGIVLSNHGGRQLDRTPTSLELIAPVRAAVGDGLEVYMDTGVRSGADIVAAVALGADAVMIGRAYLYGLMAGAQEGVTRVIEILRSDVERTLALMGVASISELTPSQVTLS